LRQSSRIGASRPAVPLMGMPMTGKVRPLPADPDWDRLLDAERRLEAELAAAHAEAQQRVARARAASAAAVPDAVAVAALAAAQEQADTERQRDALDRMAAQADARVRVLAEAPQALIDALAQLALAAALAEELAPEWR
jgi:hypothetical protein